MSDIVINKADRNFNDINMILIENANNKTNKKEIKIKGNLVKKISNEKKENSENKIVKEGTVLKIIESFWETKIVNNKICRSLNINNCGFENPINGNTIKYLTFIFCKSETLPPKIRSKPTLNENDSKKLDNMVDRNQKKVYINSKLPARFLKKKRISKINNEILNDNNISYKIIEQKEDMFLLSKTNNTKKIMKNSKEKDKKEIIMKKKDINSSNNKKELIKKLPNTLKNKNKNNINSNIIKKKIIQIPNIPSANCIIKPTVSDNSNPTFTNQINYNLNESIYVPVYGLIIDEKINRKKDIIENKISNSYVENLCDSDDETRKLDNTKSVIIDYKFDQFNHLSIEVSQHDINTLEEKNLLNDTIITFYLKFIENYFTQNCEKLVYCYNTHFCVYLQNEYKEDIEESLLNYKKLDKWGKYINIFDYEYIALPINEFNHWSLVIISNPGNIKKVFDDVSCRGINNKHYEPPKIIFLDSFFRDNENCVKVVKRFLIMEYRRKELNIYNVPNIALIKEVESRIKMIFPKVPIQNNTYDCGIYVLTFAELFLKNPKFVMSRLNEKAENENDIQNWFQSQFIQDKREFIKKLINFLSVNCNFSLYDEYMNNNKQLFHNEYNSSHKNNFNYGNSNSQSATLKGK